MCTIIFRKYQLKINFSTKKLSWSWWDSLDPFNKFLYNGKLMCIDWPQKCKNDTVTQSAQFYFNVGRFSKGQSTVQSYVNPQKF